jgi:hypothetical protein
MTPKPRTVKQQEAIERNARYQTLTTEEKLAYLDERWGAGVGSSRERARLARELETSDAESA